MAHDGHISSREAHQVADAELFMTLVVPAYNEQDRLTGMLEEAVEYLQTQYGHHGTTSKSSSNGNLQANGKQSDPWRGWEILLVSDGSTDQTIATALQFAKTHQLNNTPPTPKGPWKSSLKPTKIPPGTIRVINLEQNRGKGGAVTHGMRHARGTYVVFADADGASRFSDLGGLVQACEKAKDAQGRAVGVGSRAHMVGTEAVVKVCFQGKTPGFSVEVRLKFLAALVPPQHSHAFFPHTTSPPHHSQNSSDQRHTVWLQAVHASFATLHHPLHAFRGLDLRRGNADVGRKC